MAPTIRRAGPDDAAGMAMLHAESFADPWDADAMRALIEGPSGRAWIMHEAGEPVGFAVLHVVPPESELLSIGVRPARRRGGLARSLLAHVMHALAADGTEIMFLDVASDNDAARGLYRGLGFRDISIRPRYYPGPIDAVVMQVALASIAP